MNKEQLKAYAVLALAEMHTFDGCFEDASKILPYIDKAIEEYVPIIESKLMEIAHEIDELTDDERMMIFSCYCRFCGCKDPDCQCRNCT